MKLEKKTITNQMNASSGLSLKNTRSLSSIVLPAFNPEEYQEDQDHPENNFEFVQFTHSSTSLATTKASMIRQKIMYKVIIRRDRLSTDTPCCQTYQQDTEQRYHRQSTHGNQEHPSIPHQCGLRI